MICYSQSPGLQELNLYPLLLLISVITLKWSCFSICQALKFFLLHLQSKVFQVITNNTTDMFYVHRQGANFTQMCKEAKALWDWCIHSNICLIAICLAGKDNNLADQHIRSGENLCPVVSSRNGSVTTSVQGSVQEQEQTIYPFQMCSYSTREYVSSVPFSYYFKSRE